MSKKYYWLKLKEDFFKSKEIKKLRKIAGGDTYTIIYLKMQLLSIKNNGKIIFEGIESNLVEELALELDEPSENIEMTLNYLKLHNLIESCEQDEYLLPKVLESIGKETDSAERVRKHRLLKKKEEPKALHCNVDETNCNTEIEKEIEKEIDIEKELEKDTDLHNKKKETNFDIMIKEFTENEELKTTIYDFIKMRKTIKKPLTDKALQLIFNKLNKISVNEEKQIEVLNQSILNSWQGVFDIKEETFKGKTYDIKPKNKIASLEEMKGW